jgi:type VI secretion system protein ImpL
MKKILRFLFHPVLLAVLGLAALCALIWFVGPLIAIARWRPLEPEWIRTVLIVVVVGTYAAKKLWSLIKAKQLNTRLLEGLLRAPPPVPGEPSAGAQEVAVLRERFEHAIGVLKQARIGARAGKPGLLGLFGGRQYVYQLPWYVIIGAPGSGKTTALINSGLRFPLAEKVGHQIKGVGGTRNCDWWFADEAILLDTAGRYATHESNPEADREAWQGFLKLLQKFRPRRPINGVLLTVSIDDLLQHSAAEREARAAEMRARIQELHEQFNIRFPIYVLVTKCDLLAGFMEFFGEFGRDERAQVWGMTFPYREGDPVGEPSAAFAAEFATLEHRLNDRLVDRLQQERDPQKRALIYLFPQQFAALGDILRAFLDGVFATSTYREPPLLRGVYFTSGTQEGNPIDRVVGALARGLGIERRILPPQMPSGRSYFLTRMLRDVVFAEEGLAGSNLRMERRRSLLQWVGYASIALLAIGASIAWLVSYGRNQAYIAEVTDAVEQVRQQVEALPASGTVVQLLPVLKSVRDLAAAPGAQQGAVVSAMGFGLNQGDKLAAAADSAYRRLLQDAFLPRIAQRLEQQLRGSAGDMELLYESLKAYLMLHDASHFDQEALKGWIALDWERSLPRDVGVQQRQDLESHLDALYQRGPVAPPLPPDAELIKQARATLASYPFAQRVYSRLKRQRIGADVPNFSVTEAAGPAVLVVLERASGKPLTDTIPGLYTYDGYHKAFAPQSDQVTRQLAAEERWVLDASDNQRRLADAAAVQQLIEDVRRLYLQDYARLWLELVRDLRLKRASNLQESIALARELSTPNSPLPPLVRALVRETTLTERIGDEKGALEKGLDKATGALGKARDKFEGLLPGVEQAASGGPSQEKTLVDDQFADLRRLVKKSSPDGPAPIDALPALAKKVHDHLQAVKIETESKATPKPSSVPAEIGSEAAVMAEPVRSILKSLADATASTTTGAICRNLSEEMTATISEFCRKAVPGRYPFDRGSGTDVRPEDFARLFAAGGLFDAFFRDKLNPYVDVSTKPWSFRRSGGVQMTCNAAPLVQFQRAAAIRDVFFRGGGQSASIRLEFKPIEMDASITQLNLDVDGQLVRYAHGPQVPASVQWPGPRGSTQVRLQVSPPTPGGTSGMVFDGPWALFRMLDKASVEPGGTPERFRVAFNIDGRKASFEVVASSVQNPFRLRELEQFQCPGGF